MSDTSQGPGWWLAADGKWYAPEQEDPTYVDADGTEWWWDGSSWNCWVAEQWVPVPGATPAGMVPLDAPEGAESGFGGQTTRPSPIMAFDRIDDAKAGHHKPYQRVNICAILSLVFGFVIPMPLGAVAFGIIALTQIDESNGRERGRALAAWGIALGVAMILVLVVLVGLLSKAASCDPSYQSC